MLYRHAACDACKVPDLVDWMAHCMIWREVDMGELSEADARAQIDGIQWDEKEPPPLGEQLRKCLWGCLPASLRPMLTVGTPLPREMLDRYCEGYDMSMVSHDSMIEWLEKIGFPQPHARPRLGLSLTNSDK